jgi:hypothetical protein
MHAQQIVEQGAGLLLAVDAVIRSKREHPPFEGGVCLCVRGKKGDVYWHARWDGALSFGFVDGVPPGTRSILLLGEREADALLKTSALPQKKTLVEVGGDKAHLRKFLETYCGFKRWLDIRAGR